MSDEEPAPIRPFVYTVVEDDGVKVTIEIADVQVCIRKFWSVVRLYCLDVVPTLLREWFYFPSGLAEILGREANGKLQTVLAGGRVLFCSG